MTLFSTKKFKTFIILPNILQQRQHENSVLGDWKSFKSFENGFQSASFFKNYTVIISV